LLRYQIFYITFLFAVLFTKDHLHITKSEKHIRSKATEVHAPNFEWPG